MKPLVYYCRWQGKSLRLRGRDSEAIWGQLVSTEANGREEVKQFRYLLDSAELIVQDGSGEYRCRLDEKGIPLSSD